VSAPGGSPGIGGPARVFFPLPLKIELAPQDAQPLGGAAFVQPAPLAIELMGVAADPDRTRSVQITPLAVELLGQDLSAAFRTRSLAPTPLALESAVVAADPQRSRLLSPSSLVVELAPVDVYVQKVTAGVVIPTPLVIQLAQLAADPQRGPETIFPDPLSLELTSNPVQAFRARDLAPAPLGVDLNTQAATATRSRLLTPDPLAMELGGQAVSVPRIRVVAPGVLSLELAPLAVTVTTGDVAVIVPEPLLIQLASVPPFLTRNIRPLNPEPLAISLRAVDAIVARVFALRTHEIDLQDVVVTETKGQVTVVYKRVAKVGESRPPETLIATVTRQVWDEATSVVSDDPETRTYEIP
jgi:hypothetical protein